MPIRIGTAGWAIPRQNASAFGEQGTSLERYASRLPVVEINSSFHRPHRVSTWERWRESVPATFRFSVKLPKTITHQAKLRDCSRLMREFLAQAETLGDKLAVLLVQLPPKLAFEAEHAGPFLEELKKRSSARIALEPRNVSWFVEDADQFLRSLGVARVAADPAVCPAAQSPGGWRGFRYWRFHGSPVLYRSSYAERINQIAGNIWSFAGGDAESWCIFDNTASSAAMSDALELSCAIERMGARAD